MKKKEKRKKKKRGYADDLQFFGQSLQKFNKSFAHPLLYYLIFYSKKKKKKTWIS
jgi:hypothetical protein